ncbi:TMEM175 family protein [Rhizobium oryziradicis]|uniref:DUF1211 domain-containing membrane protein n=1 Tax=Rhizobium oryziradicis TaxID=1867956 RepID=A0A1Q8ZNF0_9HYPH|nr:TMEM175 family protein [Rhizobium oryziradicis]OLP43412.1 hypothetical protein BJF95_21300 [Rhizobium oryziradicis]
MNKGRLEAFSDGVLAIVITIMVLELKVPVEASFAGLIPSLPLLLGYALSFVYVAIYWNNHHHLLTLASRVTPGVMWANMHLLFWLTLTPFVTEWMGKQSFQPEPIMAYGAVFSLCALAYHILQWQIGITTAHPERFKQAFGRDLKGVVSPVLYLMAIGLAYVSPYLSYGLFLLVALLWIIPDKRLVAVFEASDDGKHDV